jgi:steroid delta-isomerase-like uncharacterized protein
MSEANKALVRRFANELMNRGNLQVADEICAPNAVNHSAPPGSPAGPAGVKQMVTMYRSAFPDMRVTIEDLVAEGDKVAARWSVTGTHRGELMGIPATGKRVTVTGMEINRFAGGKLVEHWESFDQLGLMQQLGVVPTPGG